jgi:hypothetical protein
MSAVKGSRTGALPRLWGLLSLLAVAAAHASDNSKSTLEVFELLASAGSHPISATPPPPINVSVKPPSLQLLKQQLAEERQELAEQQTGLTMAQAQLAFWQTQPAKVAQINVPQWTEAVATDQHLVATVQAQIARLVAQIAAAQ